MEDAADQTGVKILKSDIFRAFVRKEKKKMKGEHISGRRPDYKNWMPKWMIETTLGLTAGMAAATVLTASKGKKTTLPAVGTALFGGISAWLIYSYEQYSYNGKRQLSKQIIEGTAAHVTLPEDGIGLDVGCGSGALTIACAKRNPQGRMVGVDRWGKEYADFSKKLCEENAEAEGVDNTSFQPGNAVHLDFPDESFDAVTSNYVYHNIPVKRPEERQGFIRETLRVLKKGGTFAIHDIFSKGKYGDMEEFMKKIRGEGYEDVQLIHTDDGMFMSHREAMVLGCAGSALLMGKK